MCPLYTADQSDTQGGMCPLNITAILRYGEDTRHLFNPCDLQYMEDRCHLISVQKGHMALYRGTRILVQVKSCLATPLSYMPQNRTSDGVVLQMWNLSLLSLCHISLNNMFSADSPITWIGRHGDFPSSWRTMDRKSR